jgi:sigma-B regulation protein RsbU (phosphoserine phosphatase)
MKGRLRFSTLCFYGLTLLILFVSVISFVGALSFLNKPFAGFLIYDTPYVGSMSIRDWPGREAGLKFLERVVSIDGQPVWKGQEVVTYARDRGPGARVHYIIKSKGQIREVSLPVTMFGFRDFFLTFVINLFGGLAIFGLGCIVYVLKPRVRTSWVFLLFCFFLGVYMITSFEILSTYRLVHIHYFALCFMGITLFHLGMIFPDRKQILDRFPALEFLGYPPALIIAVGYQIYFFNFPEMLSAGALSWMPDYKQIGTVLRIFSLICAVGMLACVFHSLYRASAISAQQRARMILFGATIGFLPPAVIMAAFYFLKVNFPWNFLVVFVVFFPAFIAYSIVRHNLFEADVIIKRTVGYVVVTAVVVGAYALVSVSFNVFLGQYQLAQSRAFPILFTLGVILVFNPLRDRIQALVDRVFFRKEYNYGEIIDQISGAITSLLDLGQILKRLTQTFIDDMFINTTSVMLLSTDGTTYQVYLADGENQQDVEKIEIKRNEPLSEIIEAEKRELTKNDVLEDPKYRPVAEKCAADFEALHASLMVPLVFQDKVIGSLNLGEKKSGKAYNHEDIELLRTLAHQGAVAIENARLFQENLEKQRMEEELSIARDLQMSMLPATCPQIEGFQIAASSTPAREVGGDFFDFIEMGTDRVGFVVGDVTGKSVSGALVMSASRSVFRMLSEDDLTVGESMTRANRRLKKDVKSGMFVALLYVVLNGKEKNLNLCNAGQTQPVHLSARTGEARLVETEGDTFPLGILDEANYQETKLQLEPGDKVVFYTDGIVEAMNAKEEMFGFERLLEVIKETGSKDADALLKEVIDRANAFSEGAAQHDDLTIIVLSVEG